MPTFEAACAELDDYIRGVSEEDSVAEFEEDLFERAVLGAAPELTFRASLGTTLRAMNRRGTLDLWITASEVAKLRGSHLQVMFFDFDPGNPFAPQIPEGTDLLVTRIPVRLEGVRRLEAEVLAPDGRLLKRMPDIRFDPADGAVFACCEAGLARTAAVSTTTTRVWAEGDEGRSLVLEIPSF